MANEYFSAIGSAFSDSVTGIIDDPQYTLYVNVTGDDNSGQGTLAKPFKTPQRALFHLRDKFITQNGFAQIKLGAGRFVLDDAIEIRHPQGDRIGIKGQSTVLYNMKSCKGYTASHSGAVAEDDVNYQTQGSTAPRYYKSTITIGGGIEQTDTSFGNISINGISGEYFLVQDDTMRNADDYDHSTWDFNLNGKTAKRASLMGCNILYGANTNNNDVKMDMKYYNFPYQLSVKFQMGRPITRPTSIVRVGGTRTNEIGGRDIAREGDGVDAKGYLLAADADKYFSYSSDPLEHTIETNENQNDGTIGVGNPGMNSQVFFGSTAEGQAITLSDEILPHYGVYAYNGDEDANQKQMNWTQPKHDSTFVTLNRMTATHVKTILEFKDNTKPGILLDGAQLGYVHDMILEGKWQQFKQGFNHGGSTSANQDLMNNHVGIYVKNGGNLSYDLGKTGASLAELKFSASSSIRDDSAPISSESVTIMNVGINGFENGSRVEDYSNANLDDIVISNCGSGIVSHNNSSVNCSRSTLIGFEEKAIDANKNSSVVANRTMVAHVAMPVYSIDYAVQSENYFQRKTRDETFLVGRQIILNRDGDPLYAGIVNSWKSGYGGRKSGHESQDVCQNHRSVWLYDHKGEMTSVDYLASGNEIATHPVTLSSVKAYGITGASGDNSASGSHYEDASTTGYLKPWRSYQYKWGSGWAAIDINDNSKLNFNGSSAFYCYCNALSANTNSNAMCKNSVFAMNSGVGVSSYYGSNVRANQCRFFMNVDHGVEAYQSSLDVSNSCLESSRQAIFVTQSSVHMGDTDIREGTAMFMSHLLRAQRSSSVYRGPGAVYQHYNASGPENSDATPKPAPANTYNTRNVNNTSNDYPDSWVGYATDDSNIYD